MPTPNTIRTPPNCCFQRVVGIIRQSACCLYAARGITHVRLGSLLIQSGASIVYVKEQMGHSSIQVTVDTYGHLIPGANVSFVDRLDKVIDQEGKTTPQQNATQAQLPEGS